MIKGKIHTICLVLVEEKRARIEHAILQVQSSLASESKSTAGDKHETGRAMLQLEREKLGGQLQQLEILEQTLIKIKPTTSSKKIVLGSYVKTEHLNYYLSVSLGEIKIASTSVYAISVHSPIGQLLLGKMVGDSISFNGKTTEILEVC